MRTNSFKIMAGALALASAGWLAPLMHAQPLYDRIHVNLPYTVTMQSKTLQPGEYTIQQLPGNGGESRVLLFYTDNGMKFETSALTIPALDQNTARDTKLVLGHVGNDYYIEKIWIQGKDYGYELPVPDSIKSLEKERTETNVAATYTPTSSTDMTASNTTKSQTAAPDNANSNNPSDTTNRPMPSTTANTATTTTETAQNNHPVTQPPATQPSTSQNNSADRTMADQNQAPANNTPSTTANANNSSANRTMPNTAADWLTMLLSGGALSGAGLMLRRKR